MYAVVKTGGKQYTVREGDFVRIEKLDGEIGQELVLDQVMMLSDKGNFQIGRPMLDGAKVTAEIIRQDKSKKILVFHKKRRKGFKKLRGHRQPFTEIKITGIAG